ncbi:MAG: efflux RND transporter permease subunit [Armatimonadetes bacterium]|nr:efflux RND transporter permease subunit [Armatimonadota bacterium]
MGITRLATRNPIAVLMVCIAILVLASIAAGRIPVDMFPALNIPAIAVTTTYSGATPEEVERTITYPLERAVSRVGGIVRVQSESEMGRSRITVWFDWGTELDPALVQIISNIQRSMRSLPPGVDPPSVNQVDVSDFPVVQVAVRAPALTPKQQYELAENTLAPQLQRLPGVAEVWVRGGLQRQINVNCDPQRLQARGLTFEDVQTALRDNNQLIPSGGLRNERLDYQLEIHTLLDTVESIREVVVTTRGGVPIKVRDVAGVEDGAAVPTEIFRVDGRDGVGMYVHMQPQANVVQLADAVRQTLPHLAGVPEGVELEIIFDQSNYVRSAIEGLIHEGLWGALLVSVVVLAFLRNGISVIIICLGIPLAIAAALILLYFGDQSLNIFTLGGLTLALGRLVDDAIVVRENITRHLDEGDAPVREAVLKATSEVGMPVLASTLTTIAVFFPVVFLEGVSQKLFVPLAMTIVFSMMASYFVSMSVDPVLSIAWLRPSQGSSAAWTTRLESAFTGMEGTYERLLRSTLRRPFRTGILVLAAAVSAVWLAPSIPTEFFPESDESLVIVRVQAQLGTGLPSMGEVCRQVEALIREELGEEELLAVLTSAGNPSNQARLFVRLRPAHERRRDADAIGGALRRRLAGQVPGVRTIVTPGGQAKRILNFGAQAPIDVQLLGYDQEVGARLAADVARLVADVPGAADVQIVPQGRVPSFQVTIDRDRAALLGLNPAQVARTINTAVTGGPSGSNRFVDPFSGNEFDLVTQLEETYRNHPEDLASIPIAALFPELAATASLGRVATPLTLRDVARIELGSAPLAIQRKNQVRVIDVTANNTRPLGEVSQEIRQRLEQLEVPDGFVGYMAGQTEQQQKAFSSLVMASGLALMLVYMIMACQFGTVWEPLVIMLTVPLGLIGVVWIQAGTSTPFSVMSFMGVIMMTGIVVSNGILLVEFARTAHGQGRPLLDSVVDAGRVRLRPILMTALATVVGMAPMAAGLGGGGTSGPLALAVIGGLTVSTVLTLLVVPLFYVNLAARVARPVESGPRPQLESGEKSR